MEEAFSGSHELFTELIRESFLKRQGHLKGRTEDSHDKNTASTEHAVNARDQSQVRSRSCTDSPESGQEHGNKWQTRSDWKTASHSPGWSQGKDNRREWYSAGNSNGSKVSNSNTFRKDLPPNTSTSYSESSGGAPRVATKIAPDTEEFEHIRNEAMQLWTTGVDVELKPNDKSKQPKKNWLTVSEFANIELSAEEAGVSSTVDSSDNLNPGHPSQNSNSQRHSRTSTQKKGWSPDEEMRHKLANTYPTKGFPSQHVPEHAQPVAYFPQIQLPLALPGGQPLYTQPPGTPGRPLMTRPAFGYHIQQDITHSTGQTVQPLQMMMIGPQENIETTVFLYKVSKKLFGIQTVTKFHEKLPTILPRINLFSHRTISTLLEAIPVVISLEQSEGFYGENIHRPSTVSMIKNHMAAFQAALQTYIPLYIFKPEELLTLLRVLHIFATSFPGSADSLPLTTIRIHFAGIKDVYNAHDVNQVETLLKEISELQSTDGSLWEESESAGYKERPPPETRHDWTSNRRKSGEALPSLPNAADMLNKTIRQINGGNNTAAKSIKDKLNLIANTISKPWTDPDIKVYLITHYLLLIEELCGPIQQTMKRHFVGEPDTCDSCFLYTESQPICTALAATITDPIVIFELVSDKKKTYTDIPQEGSMVILIPENTHKMSAGGGESFTKLLNLVASGVVVRSMIFKSEIHAEAPPTLILGVHIEPADLPGFDWTKKYTLIVTRANAAAIMPVLSWLRSQCVDFKEQNISKIAQQLLLVRNGLCKEIPDKDTNLEFIPEYLQNQELDISSILVPDAYSRRKVSISRNNWPDLFERSLQVSGERSQMYTLSTSQVRAIQHAFSHHVTIVSGSPGTGKTFLASKSAELAYQGLVSGQYFQPVLVLAQNETTLDSILAPLVQTAPDLLRFGSYNVDPRLADRQGVRVAAPSASDANRKQTGNTEKSHASLQGRLAALWCYRWKVERGDPTVMATTIPPQYMEVFRQGYTNATGRDKYRLDEMWSEWQTGILKRPRSILHEKEDAREAALKHLLTTMTTEQNTKLLPIIGPLSYRNRQAWIENHTPNILPLGSLNNWPFVTSLHSGAEVRRDLTAAWSIVHPNMLWKLSPKERLDCQNRVISVLLRYIDGDIKWLLSEQTKVSKQVDNNRMQKWVSRSRFSRIIGMTADFAAAYPELIEAMEPRVVIVDEASCVQETLSIPIILGSQVEHLILFGDLSEKPIVYNSTLKGEPFNLDASLFERWISSGGDVIRLEEQWRMCSDISRIQASLSSRGVDREHSLTASSTVGENVADTEMQNLKGLTQRVLFIDYEDHPSRNRPDVNINEILGTEITANNVDEAKFIVHLALYLYQQKYKAKDIRILTVSPVQKQLIKILLNGDLQEKGYLSTGVQFVEISLVEEYKGKESDIVILCLGTGIDDPMRRIDISLALSRARFNLYIVGNANKAMQSGWADLTRYMMHQGLLSRHLVVKCQKHGTQTQIGHWTDFRKVKNGGCMTPCRTLLDCGHVCEETCHNMSHSYVKCYKQCQRPRPTGCTHECTNKCFECGEQKGGCPPCRQSRTLKLPCGHTITGICSDIDMKEPVCTEPVTITLACNHSVTLECNRATKPGAKQMACTAKVDVKLTCGHINQTNCGGEPTCTAACGKVLECGHNCTKRCGDIHTHSRKDCTATCPKQLICGHNCAKGCARANEHTERCLEMCESVCSHGYRCGRECWKVCNKCLQPCPYSCIHSRCTKKCFERCDRPPCNKACGKKLPCSHPCIGLCGEPCPPCKECSPDEKCTISLRTLSEFEEGEKAYMLPECHCVFSVESLDAYFRNQAKNGEHTAVKLWQCPSCQKPIYTALRYNVFIKTEIALVNEIKAKQDLALQMISQREKSDIINAMNEETRMGAYNIIGGRWFVCENSHPYFVGDCGGATEISKCPQCGATIGGLNHKVIESNRFYGEFDGSFEPAWPGQPMHR